MLQYLGYGGRQTSEECPEAIFVMSFQEQKYSFFENFSEMMNYFK